MKISFLVIIDMKRYQNSRFKISKFEISHRIVDLNCPLGYIAVGDGCWWLNVLMTRLRCWWPVQDVSDRFNTLRKSPTKKVEKSRHNIMIMPPTSKISHHHKVTNITVYTNSSHRSVTDLENERCKDDNYKVMLTMLSRHSWPFWSIFNISVVHQHLKDVIWFRLNDLSQFVIVTQRSTATTMLATIDRQFLLKASLSCKELR